MNNVFKVVWNSSLNIFVVVSELAKGKSKSTVKSIVKESVTGCDSGMFSSLPHRFTTITLLCLVGTKVLASEIEVFDFSPQNAHNEIITDSSILTGSFSQIKRGSPGYTAMTLGKARELGFITSDSAKWIDKEIFQLGSQTKSINYLDPITGSISSMNVYENDEIKTEPGADYKVMVSQPAGTNGQYVDRDLYQISAGASLNVKVGQATGDWVTSADNLFDVILKSSDLNKNLSSAFHVSEGGNLSYESKTVVQLGNNNNNIKDSKNPLATITAADFVGEFDSKYLGKQNVTNVDEFKAYNTKLINALKEGKISLTEDEYKNQLNLARDLTQHGIYADTSSIAVDDATRAFVNRDVVSYIHGTGSGTTVSVEKDANIQMVGSDATLVNMENGAKLINDGTLGTAGNTIKGAIVIAARNTSFVENNGVVDAGTNPEMVGFFQTGKSGVVAGTHTAVLANGSSIVDNTVSGVINVAARASDYDNTAVMMSGNAIFNNNGSINIAATNEVSGISGSGKNYGVVTQKNTVFNNNGMLYIGRLAQRNNTDASADIAIKQNSTGVLLKDNGIYNGSNLSKIIIGSKVQNAVAIDVTGNATLSQKGTIDINGAESVESISSNTGIKVSEGTQASKVINEGVINLNGLNSIGINVLKNSQITSSGTINVNGGIDPITHYANFGIYSNGEKALAILSGSVNLIGDGAIGVHAREKGIINVTDKGTVNFKNGVNQTGYYIYGAGSSINNAASSIQDASTENATLYRIDGGATYDGSLNSPAQLNASGDGATIVRTTGTGSKFSSGKIILGISGTGTTGVKIEGGASGEISRDAVITISGKDSTAGIVDGKYYDLDGSVNNNLSGNSELTTYAVLGTSNTAKGAFGYIAKNGGRLIHNGSIDYTAGNSTGILVDGGILENNSDVTVNGIAVNVQGDSSRVLNTGTVTASDGQAAFLVGKDATLSLNGDGQTLAAGSAHGILLDNGANGLTVDGAIITMDSVGSGSAIENKAEISGIKLSNTTINVGNGVGIHTGASLAQENSGTININGSGTGILFENVADGSDTDQILDMTDSRNLIINVKGSQGNGIITRASTDLKTGASVNVLDANGKSALVVEGTTKNVEQSGSLTSVAENAAVVDLNNGVLESFINKGDILAKSADYTALEIKNGNGITFTNANGANISGQVRLLSGDNTVVLESGSTATDIFSGAGKDLFILKNISESQNASVFSSLNGGNGDDTLLLDNTAYALNRENVINGIERISLTNSSTFSLENVYPKLGDDSMDGTGTGYIIDDSSKLVVKGTSDVTFKSHLEGTGIVSVDTGKNHFSFDANNGQDGFAGTVDITNSYFDLQGLNTRALQKATLQAGEGSYVHVGEALQSIGGLAFNGGTVQFAGVTPGAPAASGTILSATMDLTGRGTVQVDSGTVTNDRPLADTHLSLLEQDDGQTLIKLATSEAAVQGGAGNLVLKNKDGEVISDGIVADITQNGKLAAEGTYDYRLSGGEAGDGLYINYGLTQVNLIGTNADALTLDANGKSGNAADLSARLTGNGDLVLNSQKGQTVTLSNMDNDYSGTTHLSSGNLAMLNDNVLGNTSELKLAGDTIFDMRGHSQTIGKLAALSGSVTDLNDGHLTLLNGGESSGELKGNGALIVSAGTLIVSGENAELKATTTVAQDAAVLLNSTLGLGVGNIVNVGLVNLSKATGVLYNSISDAGKVALDDSDVVIQGNNSDFKGTFDIDGNSSLTASSVKQLGEASVHNAGKLILNTAENWELKNEVTGSGSMVKDGVGNITLSDSAQWTGATDINAGSLTLGSAENEVVLASSQVNINSEGLLSGFGGTAGQINNRGSLIVGDGTISLARSISSPVRFTVGGNLANSGDVWIGSKGQDAGNQLVVNGDYQGDGGNLYLNTALAGDNSVTDKLVVKGSTSGTTGVSVTNAGGSGSETIEGIEIIQVDGQSLGNFTQNGRIVAGAYDYSLVRGQGNNSGNWYLTSKGTKPEPEPEPNPGPEPKPSPDIRPEGASYVANLMAANTLFNTRLHDRSGETWYLDPVTGETQVSSLWLRQVGSHTKWRDGSGQLKTQSNSYVAQLGGDLMQWSTDGTSEGHLGLMAGYANSHSNTTSYRTGYGSKGSLNGYSVGAYGTWFANKKDETGLYVDSWLQYSWFNNSVKGEDLSGESYKSKGLTASVETGYTLKLGESIGSKGSVSEWFVQPQAQVTWMGVKADDHREANGTLVKGDGSGNVQTRLGMRTFLRGHDASDAGTERNFEPFAEVNWLHNSRGFSATMDNVKVSQAGARDLGEVKAGVEAKLNKNLNLWGNVGTRLGTEGYMDSSAMVGVKVNF